MAKRLLVCTVDAWSSKVGSNTMSTLLEGYDKEKIACLYIRAEMSNSEVCFKYFHILEGRVLKSIYKKRISTGEYYQLGEKKPLREGKEEIDAENKRYQRFGGRFRGLMVLAREIVWKLGRWHTKALDQFLDDFNPEVVFFPIESYIHFNRINEYIIKRCKPQIVLGYLWDDNFTFRQNRWNLPHNVHRLWLRRSVKRLVSQCTTVFAISPKMKYECDIVFGIDSVLLTKPMLDSNGYSEPEPAEPLRMVYTGKLIIGRDETIAEIVDAIRLLNKNGQRLYLDIYTNTIIPDKMRSRIAVEGSCHVKGFIPQEEVIKEQEDADILLFVESLSAKHLSARLSFSTKLTDYFSAGKCIYAVGNRDLAPIDYLIEEDAGIVSFTKETIIEKLQTIVNDHKTIIDYSRKAYNCGQRNHNTDVIKSILHHYIIDN